MITFQLRTVTWQELNSCTGCLFYEEGKHYCTPDNRELCAGGFILVEYHNGKSNNNYRTRKLRELCFDICGYRCLQCGTTQHLTIDHIYPKSRYPSLIDDLTNWQVLCQRCNQQKGLKIMDYRTSEQKLQAERIKNTSLPKK